MRYFMLVAAAAAKKLIYTPVDSNQSQMYLQMQIDDVNLQLSQDDDDLRENGYPASAVPYLPQTLPPCPDGITPDHSRSIMGDFETYATPYPYVGATCYNE